jgi:hypothetical protein
MHVIGLEDLWGCETSKIPRFLDSRFADGSEVVSLARRSRFITQKHSLVLISVTG